MAATMTSCSPAILATKSILQITHLRYRDFRNDFSRKFLRANGGFGSEYKLLQELY